MADAPQSASYSLSLSQPNDSSSGGHHTRWRFWLFAAPLLALLGGIIVGLLTAYLLDYSLLIKGLPKLADRRQTVTRVYADDGETIIAEFNPAERSIPLLYEELPTVLKNALLAEGESKPVRYLSRLLIPSSAQSLKQRINEWLISLQIERFYTKEQIIEIYANRISFGNGIAGVEAASESYLGKQAKDLTTEEAALLAGIPDDPNHYSPLVNPQAARERRNAILDLMALNGSLSSADAESAKAKSLELADTAFTDNSQSVTPYYYPVEEIRKYLEDKYGTEVTQGGLRVYTTINFEAQKKATEVLRKGLRYFTRSDEISGSKYQRIAEGEITQQQLDNYRHPDWYHNDYYVGQYLTGLITEIDRTKNEATARFGSFKATVGPGEMGQSARQPQSEFAIGDLAEFHIKAVDEKNHRLKVELSLIPSVRGAMMTLNARNGEIITMVGGYDPKTSRTNFATTAQGATGSAYAPFIYTAALEWGMTPDSLVSGAPIKIGEWQPQNFDGSTASEDLPLKTAFAKSWVVPTVHLMQVVGIQTSAQTVQRFGITVPMSPYLTSALGTDALPLDQMVSAYSAFPNKGVRVEPHLIRKVLDRDGNVLEEWEKTTYKVTNEYVALTMVSMMRGVTSPDGTAPAALSLGVPIAGKTGTVNGDHTDVWFIGYTPTYVTGVWMGSPDRKNLGNDMTGARAALPFFIEFMKDFLKDKPKEDFEKPPPMPEDMKELQKQRQREMMEGKLDILAARRAAKAGDEDEEQPAVITTPKREQVTLPPAPADDLPPPPVMKPKKKGKKGTDEP